MRKCHCRLWYVLYRPVTLSRSFAIKLTTRVGFGSDNVSQAMVTTAIRLRFDGNSIAIRLPFDCMQFYRATAIRRLRYDPDATPRSKYSRDLRSFEIRFEFESDVPIRIRFDSDVPIRKFRIGRTCRTCAVIGLPQTTLTHCSTKTSTFAPSVVEIYV